MSTQPNDGGPAFPLAHPSIMATTPQAARELCGMTLRDYFAAAALQGMLAYYNPERGDFHTNSTAPITAAFAFVLADAMLAARDGKGGA